MPGRVNPLRRKLKMNQSEFGRLLGVSQPTVWHWENRGMSPSLPTANIIKGLELALKSSGNSPRMIDFITTNARIGGLPYLLQQALEQAPVEGR